MVEGARLESVCRGNSTVGSNPTLSAKFRSAHLAERAGLGVMPRRATARREQDRIPLLLVVASRVLLALFGTNPTPSASTQHAMRREEAQAARVVRNQRSIRRLRGIVAWKAILRSRGCLAPRGTPVSDELDSAGVFGSLAEQ